MIKLGIIGCGEIAIHHAERIRKVPGLKIISGADICEKARQQFADKFNLDRTFTDYRKMLMEADLDAVAVCLPSYFHKEAAVAAAKAGKHVFCEKPIAMTVPHAEAIIDTCRRAKVLLMVGFVRRFDKDFGTFHRLVQSGVIGRPVIWRDIRAGSGAQTDWFFDLKKGGGPFMDGCVHNYDFAHGIFGRACSVIGSLIRFRAFTAPDTGTICIRYEKGDELHISWSWGLPAGTSGIVGSDIIGPRGSIRFPGSFPNELLPENFDSKRYGAYLITTADGKNKVVRFQKKDMFLQEWRHFADCIRNGKQPLTGGKEGLEALKVALAALRAGATGRKVNL